ncbi:hypothetical protein ACRALDRAFT_1041677 [Sodiomyces alcalophilus JCM 7366]|uniref:uncharacterized protein n=1 Tax=Sodiomyces alcalophilus JCM 7366 TaxID=591952 RepID=UPI0039B50ED2
MEAQSITPGTTQVALGQWTRFISRCLARRLDPLKFESFVPHLRSEYPLPPSTIADLFLRPQRNDHNCLDPRIPRYLQVLTKLRYIDTPSILKALYRYSTSHKQARSTEQLQDGNRGPVSETDLVRWESSYGAEEVMFYRLTKAVAQGSAISDTDEALEIARIMSMWMTLFTDASTAFAVDAMGQFQSHQVRDEMESARAAFVALLLGVCENQVVLRALGRPQAKDVRKAMSGSLANFIPTIMHNAGQIATRLDLFRTNTLASFEPADEKKDAANAALDHLLDTTVDLENFAIPDIPIVNTRAALYIYLNAALVGRPLIDDVAIFSFLHNRYQGDVQSSTIDLILASFDVLANAVYRNEGSKTAHVLRSYLMNKLPLLIAQLSKHMFPPLTAEFCITEALRHVDTNAFPTLSSMFDESRSNNPFTDSVREDFCWACCLHGLLRESSIETILGETPYQSLPSRGRYAKDTLVGECLAESERIQSLIGELDSMDGDVGAICQALVEVLGQLCRNKDTMALKILCSQLAQKPLALDVILLFEKPAAILHPLCELLDSWKYEEDQGEYQPVYEEFGSVLLLPLAIAYRYNLSASDLGAKSAESFVAKLLYQGSLSRPSDNLTDETKGHLDAWIRGLFDQEAGGLSDDLISCCTPQEFYLLVPTLFQHIVMAFRTGHLPEDGLKGGVEYLVDTFLLPSLVMAISYLTNSLWVDIQNQKAIIRILHFVLQPSTISNEASTMHSSVLNIIAKPLEHSLRAYQRQDPKCQDIEPLLRALKDSIPLSRQTGGADQNELEAWTNTPNGGLTTAVRNTMQGFVQWSLHPGINVMPTPYTHRQTLAAIRILGAKRLLYLIFDEIKQQSEAGNSSIIYDIAASLICAPDVNNDHEVSVTGFLEDTGGMGTPVQRRLTLRDVLRQEAEDCRRLQKTDMPLAELVVRLHRKVEAQMVLTRVEAIEAEAMLQTGLNLGLDNGSQSMDNAMAAAATATAAQSGGMAVDGVGLDLGMGGIGGDGGLGDPGNTGGSLGLGNDDIFSRLSGGGDFDWDSMDLG